MIHLFHPVEESHRPSARSGENYRYFKQGVFLLQPLKGLHSRAVEALPLELAGEIPPALAPLKPPAGTAAVTPEVSLVFGKRRLFAPRLRGEVQLHFSTGREPQTPGELYDALRERL
jgi:hypothetical protein